MAKKIQVPAIGGLRKVIIPGGTVSTGTAIEGLEGTTLSLAQLASLMGLNTNSGGGNIGNGNQAAIALGPGLSGGGTLVGVVPIRLTAPIPALLAEDGTDGDPGPPGVQGPRGIAGQTGPPGQDGQDGVDGDPGPPGPPGAAGAAGATGATGPQGPAGTGSSSGIVIWIPDEPMQDDGFVGPNLFNPTALQNIQAVWTFSGGLNVLPGFFQAQAGNFFGGLTLGTPSGSFEGPGTVNVQTGYFVNGVPIGGGGNATVIAAAHGIIPEDPPYDDDGMMHFQPDTIGPLTINGPATANASLLVISTAVIGTVNGSNAALVFPGTTPQIIATGTAVVLSIKSANSIQLGTNITQNILLNANGIVTLKGSIGNQQLVVDGNSLFEAGSSSTNSNTIWQNGSGSQLMELYGDGGFTVGSGSTSVGYPVDKGFGTINISGNYYINGIPIGGGGNASIIAAAHGMLPDEPMQDDGLCVPQNTPANLVGQTLILHAPNNQFAFNITGAPGFQAGAFFGAATTGNSFGIGIRAGTTSTDSGLKINNPISNALLYNIDGLGDAIAAGYISAQGATPAITAAQTDIGTTTTATVITTAGGIALPALASTFWVVNVNGVKYGIPCFAL